MSDINDTAILRRTANRRALLRSAARLGIAGFGATLLAACDGDENPTPVPTSTPTPTATSVTSFAIAVLPDTQFYSRYATLEENLQFSRKYSSEPYAAQTRWIADNAAKYNIPFVIHLGDVVDQVRKPDQWKVADAAMRTLESGRVPYSILAGNHDVLQDLEYRDATSQTTGTDAQRTLTNEPYLSWFPAARARAQTTFGGRDPTGFHEYHVFEAQGVKFMVLSLSWRISDAGIAWARGVIAANPTLPVILSNHQLLNIDKDGKSPLETEYGKMLWEKLIRDNDQIFMTLNGHHHGAARLSKTNNFGNVVEEMVVDYQMAYQGGNGLMRLYEFDFTNNRIDVASFSPWVVIKPKATLNQFDQATLKGDNERFSIAIDFAKRFARFNPSFKPAATAAALPILPRVTEALLAGYTDPTVAAEVLPRDLTDYPQVADTVAHWRLGGTVTNGAVLGVGQTLADATGLNPLARAPLAGTAQAGDVVLTTDKHRLLSAAGSIRFLNTDKSAGRMSWLATAANAPLNAQTFTGGYTIEAFIKIDRDWTTGKHRWCNILTRNGNRGGLPKFAGGDPESPPVLFAISSLREVQWEVVPSNDTTAARANWSGELMVDTWYHVAVVNDPTTRETTLYVDGAPVLRNTSGGVGIASLGATMPWVLGAAWWDGAQDDGYFGSIGEVRLVAKPLVAAQWLTARRS